MRYAFGIWTMVVAITVSVVAAYYSIIGLTAIFAGAVIPVIIMGAALEIGKVTTAIWLHSFWHEASFLMKAYLVPATLVLMFITSMGIFGFLSKAHIEQGANSTELTARIERADAEIARQEALVERANLTIAGFGDQVSSADESIQARIDAQQAIIDDIRARLEVDIATQNAIIENEIGVLAPLEAQLARVEAQRTELAALQQGTDVRALQRFVGADDDGVIGGETRRLIVDFSAGLDEQQAELFAEVERLRNTDNPVVDAAQAEITRLQQTSAAEIELASGAIAQFRDQLVNITTQDRTADIAAQNEIIAAANTEIDRLFEQRFELESQLRVIEVEVGPVKYIAELIYGEADKDLLEQAVRWVILILVAVFDPLAVILILAGLSIMNHNVREEPNTPRSPPAGDTAPLQPNLEEAQNEEREREAQSEAVSPEQAEEPKTEAPANPQPEVLSLSEQMQLETVAENVEQQEIAARPESKPQEPAENGFTGNDVEADDTTTGRVIRTTSKES